MLVPCAMAGAVQAEQRQKELRSQLKKLRKQRKQDRKELATRSAELAAKVRSWPLLANRQVLWQVAGATAGRPASSACAS